MEEKEEKQVDSWATLWPTLPRELQEKIFGYLAEKQIANILTVSKNFRNDALTAAKLEQISDSTNKTLNAAVKKSPKDATYLTLEFFSPFEQSLVIADAFVDTDTDWDEEDKKRKEELINELKKYYFLCDTKKEGEEKIQKTLQKLQKYFPDWNPKQNKQEEQRQVADKLLIYSNLPPTTKEEWEKNTSTIKALHKYSLACKEKTNKKELGKVTLNKKSTQYIREHYVSGLGMRK